MKFAKLLGKVVSILVLGPFTGAVLGFIVSLFLMRPNPTEGATRAPGDGILSMFCIGVGLLFSALASAIAAAVIIITQWPNKPQSSG